MDTGASSHLAENIGHNFLHTPHKPLHLYHVIVTPNIIKNLISIRQFTRDNNMSVDFDAYGFSVKDNQTRRLLLCCDSTGDLYPVTQQPSNTTTFSLLTLSPTTWHKRLGHPSDDVLRKHTKLPFYSSELNVASVFDIIHFDLWTSPISSESDLFDTFVTFRAYVNKQFNVDIKALQCDHGGEHKFNANGSLSSYKARLVANGRSQQQRIDCDETFTSSAALLQRIITLLHSEFAMIDLGSLNYFLGISAQRSTSGLFLSQSKFVEEILERTHMQHCNPCRTPVDTESKLGSDGDPPHFTALKRILRYVRGTVAFGLQLHASSTALHIQMLIGLDALLSADPLQDIVCSLVITFKRHVTLSRSSAEAEYPGVANVVAETAWLRNLLLELHAPSPQLL
ncbi:ribonuclease H-like domain-containing protein [Tanacetum coccineum]